MTQAWLTLFSLKGIGLVAIFALGWAEAATAGPPEVVLPGNRAYPESITSTSDGTLYISSFAEGGISRARPGEARAESWIAPGAYGTRSTFGVLADERANILWVCSNDASAFNAPGPSTVKGSFLKGFDLATGEGRISVALPGARTLCNDMTIGPDGSVYVTNSFAPEILRLRPGSTEFEVFVSDPLFEPPKDGAGLDGIAFGGDGNLYVNTFLTGTLLKIEVKDGVAGKVTKLKTSRPISLADGLRPFHDDTFLMVEGTGLLDRVTIKGDTAVIETIRDGWIQPTGVTAVGITAYVVDGQLSRLIDPSSGQGPQLPFRAYAVPLTTP
jgi:sugar lactone lactonase YvrE